MNYLDLFSGCGGFHKGLEQAGFKFDWVGHSEVDKLACQVYHNHFKKSECLGNVKTVKPDRLPRIDLITFGFPCQDLSVAGKRRGLHASRSGLFFEAMRIIEAITPDVFIFENVKGLLSSNEGRDFEVVLRTVADIGLYECEWQLCDTAWFLPQDRARVFFIGHLRGKSRPKVFPFIEGNQIFDRTDREGHAKGMGMARSCDANYHKGPDGKRTHLILRDNWGGNIKKRIRNGNESTFTLGGSETGIIQGDSIRALTPLEFERLQGFPDGWTEGVSNTQRYRMLGNAVSIPVVEAIGRKIKGTP